MLKRVIIFLTTEKVYKLLRDHQETTSGYRQKMVRMVDTEQVQSERTNSGCRTNSTTAMWNRCL